MSGNGRLFSVIVAPVISEKSTELADKRGTSVFYVMPDARKDEIRKAVEKMFDVKVDEVRVCNTRPKTIFRMGKPGKRTAGRKAFVRLAKGYDINFSELQ